MNGRKMMGWFPSRAQREACLQPESPLEDILDVHSRSPSFACAFFRRVFSFSLFWRLSG